jgi:hypothetical protein
MLRPGLQALNLRCDARTRPPLRPAFTALDTTIDALLKEDHLAA